MPSIILTASSYHGRCFICRRTNVRLQTINSDAIAEAYRKQDIYIKHHARCCNHHLNERGLINENEFTNMKLTPKAYSSEIKRMLDSISKNWSKPIPPINRFKNVDKLDNKDCIEITGWPKNVFLQFCSFLTSINNSDHRSIEELVALYRYWQRKGIDQLSLSKLMDKTTQQDVSRYLSQIRDAINKDFVPYFLGAKHRSRKFFIKNNTSTAKELYNINNDTLAIVVDATYTRLEKSSNNDFQYSTWSQQKMDLLIKPFTVCCTNGYFVDCYGPFKANMNDATIFRYILETDIELRRILKPNRTIVLLDRGIY